MESTPKRELFSWLGEVQHRCINEGNYAAAKACRELRWLICFSSFQLPLTKEV